MRKLTISTLILVALLLTFCGNLFAENNYELSDPEYKTFIVEQLYPYRISYYDDNSTVAFLNSYESANNDAPEDTLISLYSAMRNKNYNWFLSNWKKSDIDKFLDKDDKEGRDPEFYYQ
ncbi:MAG: hypothetical protein OET90_09370, partial [Desulfuromonadales bacterium]|nr:hypothetical protein [Desulfuromonadales bacterium]